MNEKQNDSAAWQDCPTGEFGRVRRRVESHARRKQITQISGTAFASVVIIALVFGTGSLLDQRPAENHYGGIACSDVSECVQEYLAGTLDPQRRAQVDEHLAGCEHCAKVFSEQMKKQSHRLDDSAEQVASNGELKQDRRIPSATGPVLALSAR